MAQLVICSMAQKITRVPCTNLLERHASYLSSWHRDAETRVVCKLSASAILC